MRFVETPVFTAALQRHLDDETYRALQLALLLRPTQGPITQVERDYGNFVGLRLVEANEAGFASSTIGNRQARRSICCISMRRTSRAT